MCAINGALAIKGKINKHAAIDILEKAKERGRDSLGVYSDGKYFKTFRGENGYVNSIGNKIFLSNNRAEPTTEYVKDKTTDDVQPYKAGRFIVVHNGTIANDKEIAKNLGVEAPNIDSKIIPILLDRVGLSGEVAELKDILDEAVIGSYALGIYDTEKETLTLACNYKPIYTEVYDGVLYFSSLDKFLPGYKNKLLNNIHKLEPYTIMQVDKHGLVATQSLRKPFNTKAMVVCSGGLDSTVVASYLKAQGYDISLLHFKYKARAESKEYEAIQNISKHLNAPLVEVETDVFKSIIKASRLTETKAELVTERGGEASAELAHEWVPARNLIMLSIATGIAEARNINTIALGNNLEEAGAYADNEQEFIYQFNKILPNAVNLGVNLQVIEPVGNLMKHEIVKLGLEVEAPLHLTWSCYNNGDLHCGTCGPCYMRKKAFEMNNANEVIKYKG